MTIGVANAQQEFTLYHLDKVVQASYLNPAFSPDHAVTVSLPGISSIYGGLGYSAFSVKKLFQDDGTLRKDEVIEGLKKSNHLQVGMNTDLLGARIRIHDFYVSLSAREVFDFRFVYPRGLFEIPQKGNGHWIGQEANMNNLRLNLNYYHELGLGFTYANPHSKLTWGVRGKLLFGVVNVTTPKSRTTITTDGWGYDLDMNSNIRVNMSGYKDEYEDPNFDFNGSEFTNVVLNTKNKGFAVDAGWHYKWNEKLKFSASIRNLGFINWKTNVRNYETNGQYLFGGLAIRDYSSTDTIVYYLEQIADTLEETFQITETRENYSSPLTMQTYLNADYYVLPKTKVSLTWFSEYFEGFQPGVVLGVSQNIGRAFDVTLTYWGWRNSWRNVGLGFEFDGPVQFYMATDNILAPWILSKVKGVLLPYNAKNFNIRLGVNLMFARLRGPDKQTIPH